MRECKKRVNSRMYVLSHNDANVRYGSFPAAECITRSVAAYGQKQPLKMIQITTTCREIDGLVYADSNHCAHRRSLRNQRQREGPSSQSPLGLQHSEDHPGFLCSASKPRTGIAPVLFASSLQEMAGYCYSLDQGFRLPRLSHFQ